MTFVVYLDSIGGVDLYSNISVEEAKKIIDLEEVILLDVRLKEDYDKEKIDGAINIFFGEYDFDELVDELPKDKNIIVYCKVGVGSLKAIGIMEDLGFEKTHNLLGGIDRWKERGYEVK